MSIVPYENVNTQYQHYTPQYQQRDPPAPQPKNIKVNGKPKLRINPKLKLMKYTGTKFTNEIVEIVNQILLKAHEQEPKDANTITYENTINFIRKIYSYTDEQIENILIEYFILMIIANRDNKNYYGEKEYPFKTIKNLETYKNIEKKYSDIKIAYSLLFDILTNNLYIGLFYGKKYSLVYDDYSKKHEYKDLKKEIFFAFDNDNAKKNLSLIDKIYEIHLITKDGNASIEYGWMLDFLEKAYGENARIKPKIIKFFKKITKQFFEPYMKLIINNELEEHTKNVLKSIFIVMFIDNQFNNIIYANGTYNSHDAIEEQKEELFLKYLPKFLYIFPEIYEEGYRNNSEDFKETVKILKNTRNSNRTTFILFISSLFLSLGLLGAYFAFNKKKLNNYNY
jgi:hypothetical protein